ncbi:hypothetical protein [Pseudobacillus badius]|uniref:hypothetical protein n=1 Tax=Bacillus badius TaxID=1455 RepID=UPI0007B3C01F|nr:hypothetical protein [Bacillus badius]KZR58337.1 hypothetical protein A3781_17205 [Bacillus badius]
MRANKLRFKNPAFQKAFEEGFALGRDQGIKKATSFFQYKLNSLAETEGIGPKTLGKIKEALGKEYFDDQVRNDGKD